MFFCFFFGDFEISKPNFVVIFGFPSKMIFFVIEMRYCLQENFFEVNMIDIQRKKIEKVQSPPREDLSGVLKPFKGTYNHQTGIRTSLRGTFKHLYFFF